MGCGHHFPSQIRPLKPTDADIRTISFIKIPDMSKGIRHGLTGVSGHERSKKHILLLDLDGTLVTSTFRTVEAKEEVLKKLAAFSPVNGLSIKQHIRDYFLFANQLPYPVSMKAKNEISEVITRYELESVNKSDLKPGTKELLSYFKTFMPVCVVSNSGRQAVDTTLRRFGLQNSFDLVLSRDEVSDLKPDPAGILQVLGRFGVSPGDSAMVGDTPMDVIAASRAGVISIGITDGVASVTDLAREWPDYLMHDLIETRLLLSRLWSLS